MNDEIIKALIQWNPWLEGDFPKQLIGIKRDYDVISYLKIPEIKILEGVRRSGKSTLLYQIVQHALKENKKLLYINFEDEVLRKYPLSEIYYAYLEYKPVEYLLVDEIQLCNEWVPFVRKSYDLHVFQQIWITGSNSSFVSKEYAELLTGRNLKISIAPLSFKEYLGFKQVSLEKFPLSHQREIDIKQHFQQYLNLGGFPAIALREIYQRELLINYFEDFLYKDIATRRDVNTTKLKDLAIYLATNSAKLFSYRNIAKALNLHANTVNDYVEYMKEVFLFDELSKFDYALKKQYSHDKKIYMVDTGLANAVSFRFSEDKGRILETLVYRALKRSNNDVYFHRDKKECDFLIKKEIEITQAIQVTLSLVEPDTRQREIEGLVEAMQVYQLQEGLILTLNETDQFEYSVNGISYLIHVFPVWKWLLAM